jgi:CheY-like chemotaxis protein
VKNNLSILLIEDDTIERMKFNRTIKKPGFNHNVIEAKNGEEALEFLNKKKNLPDIIILDLNMPRLNGIEFLKILKSDPVLKYIPSIILSTSNNNLDILECYKTGIAGYFIKPLKYEDYVTLINKIVSYWETNQLAKN